MQNFIAVVHKEEGSAYGVSFPDVPGCFSAADDLNDLVRNASQALSFWFEDQPEVMARGIDLIRDVVADDLAQGAFLIVVPYVRRTTAQKRVNISMDLGALDAIDAAAKDMGLTRSAYLTLAGLKLAGAA